MCFQNFGYAMHTFSETSPDMSFNLHKNNSEIPQEKDANLD